MSDCELLTAEQLAAKLCLSVQNIAKHHRAGRIPALRLSHNVVRYRLGDVLDAMAKPMPRADAKATPARAPFNPNDAYAPFAPRVHQLRAEGLSYGQVAARLNAEGHRTRTGAVWVAAQVQRVEQYAKRLDPSSVPAKALEADPPPPAPAPIPGASAEDRIRQLRAAKFSWLQIACQLDAESIPAASRARWTKRSVRLALEQAGGTTLASVPAQGP